VPGPTTRKTAGERREQILAAALEEFARRGLHGASTDAIARKAGLSQPYLFRLFGTKRELFIACVDGCLEHMHDLFRQAAQGLHGEEALHAIGESYEQMLQNEPMRLRAQMQGYAACDDPEVRETMRRGYGRLVELVENVSGVPPAEVSSFFAAGMLLNVLAMQDLLDNAEPWSARLVEGLEK
jgi:AcrR family transcriptional regulator